MNIRIKTVGQKLPFKILVHFDQGKIIALRKKIIFNFPQKKKNFKVGVHTS
jgi:hypothetical protein